MLKAVLRYERGTIVIEGLSNIPFATLDPRINALRAQAMYYPNIVEYLKKQSGIEYEDRVFFSDTAAFLPLDSHHHYNNSNANDFSPSLSQPSTPIPSLRDYQQKAFDSWTNAGMRGCVVLPTGSGKTLVGVKAIEKANAASLVVVPTLDLVDQWTSVLSRYFAAAADANATTTKKIGNLGGGSEDIQPITVSTYDSAYLRAAFLGNKFRLVIFDEVHHLAAPGYRTIAEQMAAPFRLGLTATIEREDSLHKDLPRLVGEVVFQVSPDVLARQKHLAQYEVERRRVELPPEELVEYKANMRKYHECLNRLGGVGMTDAVSADAARYTISLEKLIMMSGRNPLAREALLARNRAMNIALNSKAKLEELKEILAGNKGAKTIIFTQHNNMVYEISNRFLIPFITHKTGKNERQDVLRGFKDGRYTAIVTSKVLDEGVDVPDAELGIIVSGTGSAREFIQRLGRLLRPKPGSRPESESENDNGSKKARLIEIVSSETREETVTSAKRKRALKRIQENNNHHDDGGGATDDEEEEVHGNSVC